MTSMFRRIAIASLAVALVAGIASVSVSPAEAGPNGGKHGKLSGIDLGSSR